MNRFTQIGRLAFRVEGENWVAYFAKQGTMEDAIFLGAIRMMLVENLERKDAFMALMRECFSDTCQALFGIRPDWTEPIKGPEHERSKS